MYPKCWVVAGGQLVNEAWPTLVFNRFHDNVEAPLFWNEFDYSTPQNYEQVNLVISCFRSGGGSLFCIYSVLRYVVATLLIRIKKIHL